MRTYSLPLNECWKAASRLSDAEKLQLIARLTHSMVQKEERRKQSADLLDSLYGAWHDDEYPDSDVMNKMLGEGRKASREIIEF